MWRTIYVSRLSNNFKWFRLRDRPKFNLLEIRRKGLRLCIMVLPIRWNCSVCGLSVDALVIFSRNPLKRIAPKRTALNPGTLDVLAVFLASAGRTTLWTSKSEITLTSQPPDKRPPDKKPCKPSVWSETVCLRLMVLSGAENAHLWRRLCTDCRLEKTSK